ncbi:hypothetical protein Tco_0521652, partial [Tanacetum coccineum]
AAGQPSVSGRGLQQKGFRIGCWFGCGNGCGDSRDSRDNHPHRSVSGIGCGTAGEGVGLGSGQPGEKVVGFSLQQGLSGRDKGSFGLY